MGADRQSSLEDVLREMAAQVGELDLAGWGEHDRWRIYERVAEIAPAQDLLRRAIELEPVASLASAVVVMLLERVDRMERRELVDLLDPSVRAFPENRVRELEVLESISASSSPDVTALVIGEWSSWLQLKVIESTSNERVLALLAEHGRTKRIRRRAREARAS